MTPDTDTKMMLKAARTELKAARAELDTIRGLVDAAITECQLGSQVAAHFGRTLPDTGD